MATYSLWVTIFWSIFDACCTSEHPFFSRFEAEKGLRVIDACVVYTPFYGSKVNSKNSTQADLQKGSTSTRLVNWTRVAV